MNLSKDEINEAVIGCKKGDKNSQRMIYELLSRTMMGVCLRYMRDEDEAKDALQEGFIKIFSRIDDFKEGGSFMGWAKRIIVNTTIDRYRKNKGSVNIEDESRVKDESIEEDDGDDSIYSGIGMKDIMVAIKCLSPAYQTVFNLYAIENYTHKEIANMLGVSEGTSKSNYAKSKQKLKKILSEKFISAKH